MADAGPEEPSDVTLMSVLDAYRADGYDVEYAVENDELVDVSGRIVAPADVVVVSMRRLEGASDPADNLVVAAITVRDGVQEARGTVILRFGPEASEAEAFLLRAADDRRGQADVPGDMPASAEGADAPPEV
ncbi:MAG: hypothetical protein ABJD24_14570 [Acidimicrobiales bacterium]